MRPGAWSVARLSKNRSEAMKWFKGSCGALLLSWVAVACVEASSIKVGSFNADVFGKAKLSRDETVATLCKVLG